MSDEPEDLHELLDGTYYAVTAKEAGLIGFFCYGGNAQVPGGAEQGLYIGDNVLDMGLGLKPEYTGNGKGLAFVKAGIRFAEERYAPEKLRLSVAAFNERAVAVYSKAGFRLLGSFDNVRGEKPMRFLVMEY
ncbi:Mycothiol acetyltransferase [compost metagenome]